MFMDKIIHTQSLIFLLDMNDENCWTLGDVHPRAVLHDVREVTCQPVASREIQNSALNIMFLLNGP